jgi:hypothetical protein
MSMYCRNCGKTIEEDDIDWCPQCGPPRSLMFDQIMKMDENEMQLLKVYGLDSSKNLLDVLKTVKETNDGRE